MTAQAPRYQVASADHEYIDDNPCVKVIDFGKKYTPGFHHGVFIPFNYKAPEVIFDSQFSPSADIWSLGCTVLYPASLKFRSSTDVSERYSRQSLKWLFTGIHRTNLSTIGLTPLEICQRNGSTILPQGKMTVSRGRVLSLSNSSYGACVAEKMSQHHQMESGVSSIRYSILEIVVDLVNCGSRSPAWIILPI